MTEWNYKAKIGQMTPEELEKRVKKAYEYKMPDITTLPYVGEKGENAIVCNYTTDELIARCPETGLPDFYHIEIDIKPNDKIPELKSLKQYLRVYESLPISHEHLLDKVFNEIWNTIKPQWIKIFIEVNVRGGIYTNAEKEKFQYDDVDITIETPVKSENYEVVEEDLNENGEAG